MTGSPRFVPTVPEPVDRTAVEWLKQKEVGGAIESLTEKSPYKDYRHHDKSKLMTLSADEFIRRFLLHALPDGFHRIRHYGLFANGHRVAKLAHCRLLLAAPTPPTPDPTADYRQRYHCLTGRDLDTCPSCGGTMASLGPTSRKAPTWPDTS
jgi:Putative transposase